METRHGNETATARTRGREKRACARVFYRGPRGHEASPSRYRSRDRIKVFRWPMTRGGGLPHHRVASSLIQINRFMHRRDLETARRGEKKAPVPDA